MKRFIRYLYEYKQGKRIRNVGFVKVEAGNEETIVHMQGKGFHNSNDRELVLYLFYEENGEMIGIRQVKINLTTPMLSQHLTFTKDDVEGRENYSKINGILVVTLGGRRIAATWDDRLVDVDKVKEFEAADLPVANPLPGREEEEVEYSVPEITQKIPEGKKLTKIQRKDISKLPRCEWNLANNQFLIYGYNNYHHLILIESGNVLKIGVPGIYHIKEAKVADIFGFGEFLSLEESDLTLNEDEKHQDEPFGYWCRPVKRPVNDRRNIT